MIRTQTALLPRRHPVRHLACAGLLVSLGACSGGDGPTPPVEQPPTLPTPRFQTGIPEGWFGTTGRPVAFDVGIDNGIRRTGRAAAYLTARTPPPSGVFATIGQTLSAVTYRGRRVRLAGWTRADSIGGGGGALWMRIDGPTRTLAFDNMLDAGRAILGTSDWTERSIVLDVPQHAITITIGSLLNGGGTLRVDDLRLEVVDTAVAVTAPPGQFEVTTDSATAVAAAERRPATPVNMDFEGLPATESAWLASVARPFTTDAPGSGFDDLAELGSIVGNARVVGFGEATHGTREFFRMKHRAFEYLVERHGFTHFTIEATMPESRAMDRYVTHGEGDPRRLLSNLYFWTWNTREVLDLIEWMRAYNVRVGAPRLRFFGFDMQSPHQSIDSVRTILTRLDPAMGTRAVRIVSCLSPGRLPSGSYDGGLYRSATTDEQRVACADSLQSLESAVDEAQPGWAGRMSPDDLRWLRQYVRLVRQWEQLAKATSDAFAVRDKAMADNLLWIAANDPGARLFAWAHNGHVVRRAPAMGANVHTVLGDAYRVIGFTFGTGSFNAVGSTGTTFTTLMPHSVNTIGGGTIESSFAGAGQPRLIFDARRVTTGGDLAAALRAQSLQMRSIGAVYAETAASAFFTQVMFPQDYDGMIWFATTSPSVLLPFSN